MKKEEKEQLLLIDANSLIHRAFHALPPLSTAKGEMTNAVYGFLSILLRAIKEVEPEYIAAAFDMPGPTKRHEKFKEYKATRKKAPDELYQQFDIVKKALAVFQIPTYEKEGFEADDIIGTISESISKNNKDIETIIVSGDMDTLQLVNKNTKVYTMRKGIQDSVLFDEAAVEKKLDGLSCAQVIDYKGLRGDPSDNIPGVSGIGEKTAIQLLKEFKSIENIYSSLQKKNDSLKPALKEKLIKQKENAFLSKELATIERNVPITWNLKDAAWKNYNKKEVQDFFEKYEFGSLGKRLPGAEKEVKENARKQQGAIFQDDTLVKIEKLYKEEVFSKQVYELEKELIPVVRNMERVGIKIDVPYFVKLGKDIQKQIAAATKEIHSQAKKEFNINSTQQLSEVLFEDLGISPKGLKKTPKGVISTASPELEKLRDEQPFIDDILKYRELQKLYTTYIRPLPGLADKKGRVHTHFDQLGAATGRLSSSSPNLQNIPNQGEWARAIRKGFVVDSGWKFLAFDYSQMELRVAAHISKDKTLTSFFEQGADIHRMTASTVFGVAPDKVSSEMRFRAKALNFGVLYGMGAQGFGKAAGMSTEEAREFIDQYFLQFPGISDYMEEAKKLVRERGYAETIMGRRRYLPEINSNAPQLRAAAERMAINHPIQGTLADITKVAMVEIAKDIPGNGKTWNMLLQIHDELLFEMQGDIIKTIKNKIQEKMEEACGLSVPVIVEVKEGETWGDMKRID